MMINIITFHVYIFQNSTELQAPVTALHKSLTPAHSQNLGVSVAYTKPFVPLHYVACHNPNNYKGAVIIYGWGLARFRKSRALKFCPPPRSPCTQISPPPGQT